MPSAAMTVAAGLAAGPGSRVTRFAKSTAASVTPVRPGKTHALSPLDNAMERHTVHVVLYLRAAPGLDREQLKESLSEVLSLYPAMTGRLTRGRGEGSDVGAGSGSADAEPAAHRGWVVKCNDAGVRMVDARAAVTLDAWLATATADEEMDLLYYEPMGPEPYIWSPFYVQLTEFADKSYALGLSCTHMHNDPTAAALFFHAWAAAHRRTTSTYPPFLHAPALAVSPTSPPPAPPLLTEKASAASTNAAAMSSATFHFPASAVRTLLSSLEPGTTPFAALAAFFWLRITGAADGVGERELTLALDFRKRMYAPLPLGYYGSSVHFTRARRPRVRAPRHGRGAGPPRRRHAGGRAVARPGVAPRAAAGGRHAVPDVRARADVRGVRPRAHVRRGVRGRGATGARIVPRGRAHRRGAGARPAHGRGRRGAGRGGDAARGGDGQGLPRPRGAPTRR